MMETEIVEMPKGLLEAIRHVLRISETPGPNGPLVDLIAAIDQCQVTQKYEANEGTA